MLKEDMIPARELCIHYNIELSFITSLQSSGLVELVNREGGLFIPFSQLGSFERFVRFYYEMDINLEGIETINHLLKSMQAMQEEIRQLRNRMALYE